MKYRIALVIILLAVWSTWALAEAPKCVIGVWYQPVSSFEKWKARGINTLVGCPDGAENVSRADWMAAARQAGLNYIAKPTVDPADIKADLLDANLLAWEQPDEPDGAGNLPPEKIVENFKAWKGAGNKPVFLNIDGWKTQYRATADYLKYFEGADWIGFDYYILNRGEGPANINKIGERLDKLKAWTGGKKKLYVFIECSDQNLRVSDWAQGKDATGTQLAPKMRGPTADEMVKEMEVAMAHGAAGIVYFPDVIGKGWESFDGTTPECEVAMKIANAKLTAAAEKALGNKAVPAVVRPADPKAPLDGHEITVDGVTYILKKKQP
jgi:hypothetical protein